MSTLRLFAIAAVSGATIVAGPAIQAPGQTTHQTALADFATRVQAYTDLRGLVLVTVPGLQVSADVAAIRHASDAQAAAIRNARAGARQGDIYSPAIASAFRAILAADCDEDYRALLAEINEELDAPLPRAAVHGRWLAGAPVPTMPPDLLAALPRLPESLQYRFINRDLVLVDLDANLIVDLVPEAIPSLTAVAPPRS
jgi:hypothetical protein